MTGKDGLDARIAEVNADNFCQVVCAVFARKIARWRPTSDRTGGMDSKGHSQKRKLNLSHIHKGPAVLFSTEARPGHNAIVFALDRELRVLLEKLQTREIAYALCGGLAMAVHGYPRATLDIDLVARGGSASAILLAAREVGFTLEAAPMSFVQGSVTIIRITKIVAGSEDALPLDILTLDQTLEKKLRYEDREWDALTICVVTRASLVDLKLLRKNHQDIADIERLQNEL